ncbi:hypothetical protein CYMTET_8576 [Cymbomonas tetramitiformis]|uniref:Uncharacterized protein n=1 Tax=Cymbomonas tetramitiformis TaxID=36881 RepID=A0AAE0LFY5_9CHLO|nr:hypothetical protein CYMTET_8576 [Cymbomonas tetramitiformis]
MFHISRKKSGNSRPMLFVFFSFLVNVSVPGTEGGHTVVGRKILNAESQAKKRQAAEDAAVVPDVAQAYTVNSTAAMEEMLQVQQDAHRNEIKRKELKSRGDSASVQQRGQRESYTQNGRGIGSAANSALQRWLLPRVDSAFQ